MMLKDRAMRAGCRSRFPVYSAALFHALKIGYRPFRAWTCWDLGPSSVSGGGSFCRQGSAEQLKQLPLVQP